MKTFVHLSHPCYKIDVWKEDFTLQGHDPKPSTETHMILTDSTHGEGTARLRVLSLIYVSGAIYWGWQLYEDGERIPYCHHRANKIMNACGWETPMLSDRNQYERWTRFVRWYRLREGINPWQETIRLDL